ncbi:MAG: hypothetical protein FJW26_13055 [Acidimicrobiia bacterium]|nr:hypothetical protein [Acidimicrobiia bacterium]
MDGRLNSLKHAIAKLSLDIVEAFHPPPMGDLPLGEALQLWKDKAIWIGFPGSVYSLGPDATRSYALDLLGACGTGERLAVTMSTENQVSDQNLLVLAAVLEHAHLPLNAEQIGTIAARSGR